MIALVPAALAGCLPASSFRNCGGDADCAAAGTGAHCERNGACSLDDATCEGGRRYAASAGNLAGTCVVRADVDAPVPDGRVDAGPTFGGRECAVGGPLARGYSDCAGSVCDAEPRCCAAMWDEACVRRAERACHQACSTMALVGATPVSLVIDTTTYATLAAIGDDGIIHGAWADYDGDGLVDLATVGVQRLRVFHDDGWSGNTLMLRPVLDVDWSTVDPAQVFAGSHALWTDVDRDGHIDVVFLGDGAGVVYRWIGGTAPFGEPQIFATPVAADAAADPLAFTSGGAIDLDNDTYPDLVVGSWKHPARIYKNDHGTLVDTGWRKESADWTSVVPCDVGASAAPELLVTGEESSVYQVQGGTLGAASALPAGLSNQVACGDFDGDGTNDVVIAGWAGPTRIMRNPTGNLAPWQVSWADPEQRYESGLAIGDIGGDGRLDALAVVQGDVSSELQVVRYTPDAPAPSVSMAIAPHTFAGIMARGNSLALASQPPK